jgi:hypothetical protein
MTSSEATDMKRIDQPGLAQEELPSLDSFYEEPGGNITPGWYAATVLEGYATGKGTQFTTTDEPFQGEGRRIFRLALGLTVGTTTRNLQKTFFYSPESFTIENLAHIKAMREQFKGQKSWAGQGQAQNFSITLGHLSQLEKAIGFKLARHPNGGLLAAPYVGKKMDVRVSTGKTGYDDITGFAPAGTRSAKK